MPKLFYSSRAKFIWACKKLKGLESEIRAYRDRDPYRVTREDDLAPAQYTFWIHVLEEMPGVPWGLQIGDCLQAFRSSLDHAICEIASRRAGIWPRRPKDEGRLQFPIGGTPREFKDQLWHLGELKADDVVRTCVERLQPYSRPNPAPLTLLRDLNNRDKHRTITVVRAAEPGLRLNLANRTHRAIHPEFEVFRGPLKDGAKFLVIRFKPPEPSVEMESRPEFLFYPAIEYLSPVATKTHKQTEFIEVTGALASIRMEVRYCLRSLSKFAN
jgi:hypothetical protein